MADRPFDNPDDNPANPYMSHQLPGERPEVPPEDEDMTTSDWVLAILCSGIGCILGIVWLIQGKRKGGKMLGISIAFGFLWRILFTVIEMAAQS